ncbi:MAG TPA: hypothetical protein VF710_24345 [Longimicrobium sp.]|jgi:hypothetical protein
MSKLEKLDSEMFLPLTDSESYAILGGTFFTFIGMTAHGEYECIDYRSGDDAEQGEEMSA